MFRTQSLRSDRVALPLKTGKKVNMRKLKAEQFPGFDADRYLALNLDVAQSISADADAASSAWSHYLKYGGHEMRRVRAEGEGIYHPESRLLSGQHRKDWLTALRDICFKRNIS
ncbi:hypothetical protein FGG78_25070, partial [Thioclava sp. BHET1]